MLLAGLGGLWAAVTLPLTATAWGVTQWVWVFDYSAYVWARQWASDPYIVFGALACISFLTIGIALLPDLRRARWGGIVMAWLVIAGAPITALSYLNTPEAAPLHFLWGGEFYILVAVSASGVAAAASAGPRWRIGVRSILGLTLLILLVGTLALGYWPHGTLVALAIESIAVIAAAPRDVAFVNGAAAEPLTGVACSPSGVTLGAAGTVGRRIRARIDDNHRCGKQLRCATAAHRVLWSARIRQTTLRASEISIRIHPVQHG